LRDIWPTTEEVAAAVKKSVRQEMFAKEYSEVFAGDATWNSIKVPSATSMRGRSFHLYQARALFRPHGGSEDAREDLSGVHALAVLGFVTTDHIPRRQHRGGFSSGKYLISLGVKPATLILTARAAAIMK